MSLQEKIHNTMEKAVENCEVAGVSLLVERDGEELCYCQAGMADREGNRPMSRHDLPALLAEQAHHGSGGNDPDGAGSAGFMPAGV